MAGMSTEDADFVCKHTGVICLLIRKYLEEEIPERRHQDLILGEVLASMFSATITGFAADDMEEMSENLFEYIRERHEKEMADIKSKGRAVYNKENDVDWRNWSEGNYRELGRAGS